MPNYRITMVIHMTANVTMFKKNVPYEKILSFTTYRFKFNYEINIFIFFK